MPDGSRCGRRGRRRAPHRVGVRAGRGGPADRRSGRGRGMRPGRLRPGPDPVGDQRGAGQAGGLADDGEAAPAFPTPEPPMAARITRAKKKIAAARVPYRVPDATELPERLAAVLDVVHLLFTTGHTAPAGASLQRRDLTERALDLARMLRLLLPGDSAAAGLLALILLTDARRHARTGPDGQLRLLADQDPEHGDRA